MSAQSEGLFFRLRVFVAIMAGVIAMLVAPTPAHAVGTYSNALIADNAMGYNGQWGGEACANAGRSGYTGNSPGGVTFDGQCRAFVNCIVWMSSSNTQWLGGGGGNYFNRLEHYGQRLYSLDDLVKGDVVQQYPANLHTYIIVARVGGSTFQVVDSNSQPSTNPEKVRIYNRTVTLNENNRAYRLGTVTSATPPASDAGDARSDLVVAQPGGGFATAFGTPNGTLAEGPVSLANWTIPTWGGAGDFNGDGRIDILVAQGSGGYTVAIGQSNGTFTEGGITLPGWGTGAWAGIGNFYGGSQKDLVVANPNGGFSVGYGTANGTLAEGPVSLANWTVPTWAGTGDLNGDGYSDILVAQPAGGFALALGHANGIFTEGGVTLTGWGMSGGWAATGRLNNDNRDDLVVARPTGGFAVAFANPNGTLTEGPVSLTGWTVSDWAGTGDFNGDSYVDILVAQANGGFALALGNASGTFTEGGTTLPGWGTSAGWASNGSFAGSKGYGYVS